MKAMIPKLFVLVLFLLWLAYPEDTETNKTASSTDTSVGVHSTSNQAAPVGKTLWTNYYGKPWTTAWPEPSKNKERFKKCAAILREAVDTNQVEMVLNKAKDRPEAAFAIKEIVNAVHAGLDEFAVVLETMELKAYLGKVGYAATGSNSVNTFFFLFWSENGPVVQMDRRAIEGEGFVRAEFHQNGKLKFFETLCGRKEYLSIKENGDFSGCSVVLDNTRISVTPNGEGGLRVQKFNLKNKP